jgi:hypothetical protein
MAVVLFLDVGYRLQDTYQPPALPGFATTSARTAVKLLHCFTLKQASAMAAVVFRCQHCRSLMSIPFDQSEEA